MSKADIDSVNRIVRGSGPQGRSGPAGVALHARRHGAATRGPLVKGRDAIKQMWGTIASQVGLKDVTLRTLDLEVVGDAAHEVGEATLQTSQGTMVVKFVVVWKRVDGQWRLHRDIWNTNAA